MNEWVSEWVSNSNSKSLLRLKLQGEVSVLLQ